MLDFKAMLKSPVHWVVLIVIFGGGAVVATSPQVRGLRNKNPGNIRFNASNNWQGQTGQDNDGFVIFDTFANGVRAMGRVLDSYRRRGVDRVSSIIGTWAPVTENDTDAYIVAVTRATGLDASHPVTGEDYPALVAAIIRHENGVNPFSSAQIERWLGMAGSDPVFVGIS